MSKVYTYMVIAVGLTFLLKFAGIPSGADAFISWLGLSETASGISLGLFMIGVAAVFTASVIVGGTIQVGFFGTSTPESKIVATFATAVLVVFTSTFVSIITYTKDLGFIYYITWLIFIPLLVGFGISIIEYWRGSG